MRRFSPAIFVLVLLLSVSACTKRVPVESGKFDAMDKYVLTFADGSSLRGKIGLNESVEVISNGQVFHGTIVDMTQESIFVEDCRLIRSVQDGRAEAERMAVSRHNLEDQPTQFEFAIADVQRVERVKIDPLRTATRSAFFTLTGVVSAFLISEKS